MTQQPRTPTTEAGQRLMARADLLAQIEKAVLGLPHISFEMDSVSRAAVLHAIWADPLEPESVRVSSPVSRTENPAADNPRQGGLTDSGAIRSAAPVEPSE